MNGEDVTIRDAIIGANKLGAQGWKVIDFARPTSAAVKYEFILIGYKAQPPNADEVPWYERPS